MLEFSSNFEDWKVVLDRLSAIREQEVYTPEDVEYIRTHLQSPDDRIRGGAALAAEGCLFEPDITETLIELAENDRNNAVRKAAIQSLSGVIHEGVIQNYEENEMPEDDLDVAEEWHELQEDALRENYFRVKNLLFNFLQDELEDIEIRESALGAVADLGFLPEVREWIRDFVNTTRQSSKLVALHAMGKYPRYWKKELSRFLAPNQPKPILMEAISSSYASESEELAQKIEKLLSLDDPDILSYALITLANLNFTPNLGEILQSFSLHEEERVRKAAKDAIELFTQRNFDAYLSNELGMSEE